MKRLTILLCGISLYLGMATHVYAAYGIQVKLVWQTRYADLDLELYPPHPPYWLQEHHLEAGYNLDYNGCFWFQPMTNWGCRYSYDSRGGRSSNPSDPFPYTEQIVVDLDQLQANPGRYVIAVRYFNQRNYGDSPYNVPAEVEIYHFGQFVGKYPVVMPQTGEVKIIWSGQINQHSTGFVPKHYLHVQQVGTGSGTVMSQPAGIACGWDCHESYVQNTQVTLTASPAEGSAFVGWQGACAGHAATTTVTMATAQTCQAEFEKLLTECRLYGVQDNARNDSQLFKLHPETGALDLLGPERTGADLEALDAHPTTQQLYAASSRHTVQAGMLYEVNPATGAITEIGATGFNEIDSIAFAADGRLWGWVKGVGLVDISTTTGAATVQLASEALVEDLTWHPNGHILYAVDNQTLWAFDGDTATVQCELPNEVEALETLPDGRIVFSQHGTAQMTDAAGIYQLDIETCLSSQLLATPSLYDIEGLAWRCAP